MVSSLIPSLCVLGQGTEPPRLLLMATTSVCEWLNIEKYGGACKGRLWPVVAQRMNE